MGNGTDLSYAISLSYNNLVGNAPISALIGDPLNVRTTTLTWR